MTAVPHGLTLWSVEYDGEDRMDQAVPVLAEGKKTLHNSTEYGKITSVFL